jgi:hypothetical protein
LFHIQIGYIHLRTIYQGIFFHATRVSSVTSGSQRIFVASAWTRKSDPEFQSLGWSQRERLLCVKGVRDEWQ